MVTDSHESGELIARARQAFPWFDADRLSYFVDAVQEAAYRASRIEAARQPSLCPGAEREHLLAMAILETVSLHVQGDSSVKVA